MFLNQNLLYNKNRLLVSRLREMLEDFLSKLGASTRITVGVSISPSVGVEMIEVDRLTQTVSKYSNRPLEYNYSSREILDYDQFESALAELFAELNIPNKSNIILSIPNVHFGLITLPLLLTDDAINNAIISEVEQSYIFKRQEPVVSWCEVSSSNDSENRTLAYTAIQKGSLELISEACANVGCKLIGIENSYASLLKSLSYSESTKEQMKDNVTWNLMVIGQNNYSILSMSGKKVLEYYEEPLALKSFVNDEIYNAIATSAQLTLSGLPANYLYIVSETDLVSAEVLSMRITSDSTINFLECNKFTQNEMIPVNLNILPKLSLVITPEAIGAAVYPFSDYPLKLNLIQNLEGDLGEDSFKIPKVNVGNLEIELTPAFLKRILLIVGGIILIPLIILTLLLSQVISPKEEQKLAGLDSQVQSLNQDIAKYKEEEKSNTFNLNSTTNEIIKNNKNKLAYYEAIGLSIPKNLWVTSYTLSNAGKVDIQGKSGDVKNIYSFYKDIKQLVNNSDVKLYKLEIASESMDDIIANSNNPKTYSFEITNMSEAELAPPATTTPNAQNATQQGQTQTQNNTSKPMFTFGKTIFSTPTQSNGAPQNAQTPANGQLPNNLEKIEKF